MANNFSSLRWPSSLVRFRASPFPSAPHLHLIHHYRWFCLRPASKMNGSEPFGPLEIRHVPTRCAVKQHLLRLLRPSPFSPVPQSPLPILFAVSLSRLLHFPSFLEPPHWQWREAICWRAAGGGVNCSRVLAGEKVSRWAWRAFARRRRRRG